MRHAYLIIAHTEFGLLENLLSVLDNPNNDLFVHIDRKVTYTVGYRSKYSRLFIIPDDKRVSVQWGEDSLIHAELVLYRHAQKAGIYGYYHLISGIDMPIKPQKYIHDFFERHKGYEFIGLTSDAPDTELRLMRFHFFIPRKGLPGYVKWVRRLLHGGLLAVQKALRIKRGNYTWNILAKGTEWCSLTHAAVAYILAHEDLIRKRFVYTLACDEVYKQTLLINSPFADRLYDREDEGKGCVRLIDWERGYPYEWTMHDWDELMDSDLLFARKFTSRHIGLVDKLTGWLKASQT